MQTLTVQVTNQNALKALHSLEDKQYIKIVDDSTFDSAALPGNPLSISAFKKWIKDVETEPTISLKDAKRKWEVRKKQLLKTTK